MEEKTAEAKLPRLNADTGAGCFPDTVIDHENDTITFQGVEYIWDQEDNTLTDPDNYDEVGVWNSGVIEFSEGKQEQHLQHENHVKNQ